MVICTVCGDAYLPTSRWREDICDPCFAENFRASDELRIHAEVEPTSLTLTPRQVQALTRIAQRHQQQAEDARG